MLVPNSTAYGISKRLEDAERKRLRRIVDAVRPSGHGLIVRTAAAGASAEELRARHRPARRAVGRHRRRGSSRAGAGLLYREPAIAVRVIREELNREYRAVVIDDRALFEQVRDYVGAVNPELADRVEYYDPEAEQLPVFERFHVHEQLHKALDRKVYLPSGGSLVIDRTEALTVIDVNTGKNVGTTNLEETVYRNNLEAADEVARQLRLRDIGGIIVIDFIDMEIRENRDKVGAALRTALARDKTRTQVFDISELGLVEMTRKRVSEGLIESCRPPARCARGGDSTRGPGAVGWSSLCTQSSEPEASRSEWPRARSSAWNCWARSPAREVDLHPVLVVDGGTVLATPGPAGRRHGDGHGSTGEELGPKIRGYTYKNKCEPEHPVGTPPAVLDHLDHRHHRRLTTPTGRPAADPPASPITRSTRHVQDQGRRFHPQRPRLERPAPGREGLRWHRAYGPAPSSCASGAPGSTPA